MSFRLTIHHLALTSLACLSLTLACKKQVEPEKGEAPPPPIASSKPGACANGGGEVKDPQASAYVPRSAGDYCVDPNSEQRAFGENSSTPLDAVCNLFDGECEIYKRFGLRRVFTVQYIDGKGSPGTASLTLSRFASPEAAYAFFTKRVIADADPLESAPQPLDAGAAGALGSGIAYVFRGDSVGELRYVNELESPDQIKASSQRVLPPLAKALGEKLPGEASLPPAARLLPKSDLIPLGIAYDYDDLFGVSGAGRGAVGFYRSGAVRYRLASIVRDDEASAKDVFGTLKKLPGAKTLKDQPFDALTFTLQDGEGPKVEWLVGRKGNTLVGAGDEPYALASDQNAKLPEAEKLAKVKAVFESAGAAEGGVKAPVAPSAAPSAK
jgi:hypothetical protein